MAYYRLRELNTLKGHVESVVRLKGLDIDTIQQAYTVWVTAFAVLRTTVKDASTSAESKDM